MYGTFALVIKYTFRIVSLAACDVTVVNPLNPNFDSGSEHNCGLLSSRKSSGQYDQEWPKVFGTWVGVHSPGCRDIWWLGRGGPGNVQPYQQEVGSGLSLQ